MANFEPKEFNASDINGGQRFRNGDGVSAEAINAPIESALYTQKMVKEFNIPKDGTAGQILTKTETGTAWQDAPSGASFSYYTPQPMDDYAGPVWKYFLPNLTNISKIEVDSFYYEYQEYSYTFSENQTLSSPIVIYENGEKKSFSIDLKGESKAFSWNNDHIYINQSDLSGYYYYFDNFYFVLKIYSK